MAEIAIEKNDSLHVDGDVEFDFGVESVEVMPIEIVDMANTNGGYSARCN
jgi:hypothetical protein